MQIPFKHNAVFYKKLDALTEKYLLENIYDIDLLDNFIADIIQLTEAYLPTENAKQFVTDLFNDSLQIVLKSSKQQSLFLSKNECEFISTILK